MKIFAHFLFFSLTFFIYSVKADGIRVGYYGSRQGGMAHAGTGWGIDASSIFSNPGATAMLRGHSVMLNMGIQKKFIAYQAKIPTVYQAISNNPLRYPMSLYYTVRPTQKSRFGVGFGIYTPFNQTTKWESDWKGKYITTENSLSVVCLQPNASIRVTEYLSIGVGPVLALGNYQFSRAISIPSPERLDGTMTMYGKGMGMGFNTGLFIKASSRFSLGISYRSATKLSIERGSVVFNVPNNIRSQYIDTQFNTSILLPDVWNVGIAFKPANHTTIVMDINRIGSAHIDSLVFQYDTLTSAMPNLSQSTQYKNHFNFRLGAEMQVHRMIALRIGGFYELSPVKDEYVSPSYPDANTLGVTGGIGLNYKNKVFLDIASQYSYTGARTSLYASENFEGTYKSNQYLTSVGLSVAF